MYTIELLPKGRTYYKANLHCHTVISDGRLTPEEVKREYQKRGYQIVAFTEHNIYTNHEELNDGSFLAIGALETDINAYGERTKDYSHIKTYHLNWYDTRPGERTEEKSRLTRPEQRYGDLEFLNGYISAMNDLGFLCCYNHPYWSLQNYDDYKGLEGLWGMEIYNHGCELDGMFGYHPQAYDELLRAGRRIFCVSTDDNHNVENGKTSLCDSFGGYVRIGAEAFTYADVMRALQNGEFYSCSVPDGKGDAPEIYEMTLTGRRLSVKCSPAERIFIKTGGRNCYKAVAGEGETLTEAEFLLSGNEIYIRADICDKRGGRTNSNAYFLDTILRMGWEQEPETR